MASSTFIGRSSWRHVHLQARTSFDVDGAILPLNVTIWPARIARTALSIVGGICRAITGIRALGRSRMP
jgi:hypothetical protein